MPLDTVRRMPVTSEPSPEAISARRLTSLVVTTLITTVLTLAGTIAAAWFSFRHDDRAVRRGERIEACALAVTAAERMYGGVHGAYFVLIAGGSLEELLALIKPSPDDRQMQDAIGRIGLVSSDRTSVEHARRASEALGLARLKVGDVAMLRPRPGERERAAAEATVNKAREAVDQLIDACRREVS